MRNCVFLAGALPLSPHSAVSSLTASSDFCIPGDAVTHSQGGHLGISERGFRHWEGGLQGVNAEAL